MNMYVFADDLTGANATAIQLKYAGFETMVHLTDASMVFSEESDFDVRSKVHSEAKTPVHIAHVFNTGTRNMSSERATQVLQKYIEPFRAITGMVTLRIDSTLRGPIAASMDLMLSMWPNRIAIVVPAYPSSGRTTVGGIHYVNGVPVHETPAGRDPFAPVHSSDLRVLIGKESMYPSEYLGLKTVQEGEEEILNQLARLAESGVRMILCDAETDADIESIAKAAESLSRHKEDIRVLSVDPGPFTSAFARTHVNPIVFGISASIMHNAKEQMDYLEQDSDIGVFQYSGQSPDEVVRAMQGLAKSARPPYALFLRTDTWNLTESKAAQILERLPLIVQMVICTFPNIAGIYLSGGEAAQAVLVGSGVTALAMEEELAPLTTLCKAVDGAFAGKWIVTKGGAIGDKKAVSQAISELHSRILSSKGGFINLPPRNVVRKE